MNYVGIDLHKKSITVCVVNQGREILERARLMCDDPAGIEAFFAKQAPFQAVVEASASTEWLLVLLEPLADRLVLAHPKRLRIIAESTRKTDKLDAQILAEFLALDMIPEAYRSIPGVGFVTIEVMTSELGDIRRFRSQKRACAYAGLAPGRRESAGRYRDLSITKEGSSRLRWVLVEAAWRLVRRSRRWGAVFEGLARRRGRKRAIVAVARRLMCVMASMLQAGRRYEAAA